MGRNTEPRFAIIDSQSSKSTGVSEGRRIDGWAVLPMRWVVEQAFGSLNLARWLAKYFEVSLASQENFVIISHSMILLRRFN